MTAQGEVGTREFLYVHFKRRRMPVSDDVSPERYLISPLGFSAAPSTITPSCLKELGKGKFPDPMWVSAKWANAKQRMTK